MPSSEPARPASQVTLKTVFTVSFGVLAVTALVFFLLRTQLAVTLSLAAAMVAVAMNHAVEVLTRRGLRRKWAVPAVVIALLVVSAGVSVMLIPPVVSQAKALFAAAPALWQKLQQTRLFLALDARFDLSEQLRQSMPAAAGAVAPVLTAIGGLLSAVGGLVTLLLLAIFMLLFGRDLVAAMLAEASPSNRKRYERIVEKVYSSVGGYVGGLIGICSINATLTTVFLAITGMPFFLPLGILSGFSSHPLRRSSGRRQLHHAARPDHRGPAQGVGHRRLLHPLRAVGRQRAQPADLPPHRAHQSPGHDAGHPLHGGVHGASRRHHRSPGRGDHADPDPGDPLLAQGAGRGPPRQAGVRRYRLA